MPFTTNAHEYLVSARRCADPVRHLAIRPVSRTGPNLASQGGRGVASGWKQRHGVNGALDVGKHQPGDDDAPESILGDFRPDTLYTPITELRCLLSVETRIYYMHGMAVLCYHPVDNVNQPGAHTMPRKQSREGKRVDASGTVLKAVRLELDPVTHKTLRVEAANQERSMAALVKELVEEYLAKRKAGGSK